MKQSEVKNLTAQEIQDNLLDFQKQLHHLKMTHAVSPLDNPLQIRTLRRTIARLKTAFAQASKEITE